MLDDILEEHVSAETIEEFKARMASMTMEEVLCDPEVIHELHRFCGGRPDWLKILLQEHNDHVADQDAPLRPELAKAWTTFRPALHRARACLWLDPRRSWSRLRSDLKEFCHALAAAFYRADDQDHRLAPTKFACRHIGHVFDRLCLTV
jgi:hypothetical protein